MHSQGPEARRPEMADMDVVEINEAFASQVLACVKELEAQGHPLDMERLNPLGGAICLRPSQRDERDAHCSVCHPGNAAPYRSVCRGVPVHRRGPGLATIFERLELHPRGRGGFRDKKVQKAGIKKEKEPICKAPPESRSPNQCWIPAFAGMMNNIILQNPYFVFLNIKLFPLGSLW